MVKIESEKKPIRQEHTFDFFESNFKDVLNKNPLLATKIDVFMKNVSQKYQPDQVSLIKKAVVIGAVAHQNNEIEKKRFRKAGNSDENPTPYFFHPIEMAECMISPSKEDPTFDWITIVATLLHDVPEDVKLDGIEGRGAWLSTINGIFKDSENPSLLISIINGVTERKLPPRNSSNETETLYERLGKTPMYKMIVSYIKHGGMRHMKEATNHIYSEDKKNIAEVVYNLEHLFLSATRTPEELRIFFIKIADVWHNLQSPEWVKDVKILRGRIAAGLADILGWDLMRDKIIVSLAKITDVTTPFSPHTEKGKELFSEALEPLATEERLADIKIIKTITRQMGNKLLIQPSISGGYPLPHSDEKISTLIISEGKTTLPQPEIRLTIPAELFENLRKEFISHGYIRIDDHRNKSGASNIRIKHEESSMERLVNLLGRKRINMIVKPGNRNSFMMRIEDSQPHVIDMFTLQNSKIIFTQIPELSLLHQSFSLENESLLNIHIQALIGFCYEPNLIGQAGEGIVPVFHRASSRLFFLPKTLRVQEASEICGIPELKAKYSGQVLRDLYRTEYKQALRRIIEC
jgi:hypothetical protein